MQDQNFPVATVATPAPTPPPASPLYQNPANIQSDTVVAVAPTVVTGVMSEARHDATIALAHDLKFTLTIGQAQDMFRSLRRRPPSERSIQRYCNDKLIMGQLIHTSFGREWLLNEHSLIRYIETLPLTNIVSDTVATQVPPPPQASPTVPFVAQPARDTVASGDAGIAKSQDMTPVTTAGSTVDPVGERRTLADVLIENSRLLAVVEGKDAQIAEMKDEQAFMREEVRDARTMRRDVTAISTKMLDVLRAIGTRPQIGTPEPTPDTRDL
jgi:hypothetical protein